MFAINKLTCLLLLALMSSNAMAEWVRFGSSNNSTVYADPATIRRIGNMVQLWQMNDLETADTRTPKPHMSRRMQVEYDCKEEQSRVIYMSFFSGNMGGGDVLNAGNFSEEWQPVPPGTMNEVLFKFSCETKPKWVEVGSDENDLTNYIDLDSIHKKGSRVKIWGMYDFKIARDFGDYKFKSHKRLTEYDCKKGQYRMLSGSFHYGSMGIGEVLDAQDSTGNWEPVIPDSIEDAYFKFACKKK